MSDTLLIDSTRIAAWQDDGRYDYDREMVGGSQNLLDWIVSVITEWVNETFDVMMDNDVTYYTLLALGVLLVGFLVWLLRKKGLRLFYGKKEEEEMDYEVEEDTIYGVDFDADLKVALEQGNYRQAVRLLYLQTLYHLQEEGKIDWQPSKTPTQYMRQVDQPSFSRLTRLFILVRYGNFEATEEVYRQMKALQEEVMRKGGEGNEQ